MLPTDRLLVIEMLTIPHAHDKGGYRKLFQKTISAVQKMISAD
jgi:hypothetical protein